MPTGEIVYVSLFGFTLVTLIATILVVTTHLRM